MLRYGTGEDDWGTGGGGSSAQDDIYRGPSFHYRSASVPVSTATIIDDPGGGDDAPPRPLDPAVRARLLRRHLHDSETSDQPLPSEEEGTNSAAGSVEFFTNDDDGSDGGAAATSEECSICK